MQEAPAAFFNVGNRINERPAADGHDADIFATYDEAMVAKLEDKIRDAKSVLARLDREKADREDAERLDVQLRRQHVEMIETFENSLRKFDAVKPNPTGTSLTSRERFIQMVRDFYFSSTLQKKPVLLNFPADLLRDVLDDQTAVGTRETGENSFAVCRGLFGKAWGKTANPTVAQAAEKARDLNGSWVSVEANER